MARLPYIVPYDPGFLGDGFEVPLPTPRCRGTVYNEGEVIDYIHFSLVLNQDRRSALFTAHNVDTSRRRSVKRTGWGLDPRIPAAVQTGPSAYSNNPWDRGHLVRRAAVAWGDTTGRAKDASDSTFFYPNASMQHRDFNQEEWLKLEDWVLNTAGGISSRLCVLTGPIYTLHDKYDDDVRVPSAFFKIVVLRDPTADGDDLAALGFMMQQNELWSDWAGNTTVDLQLYQVGIPEIASYTGLDLGPIGTVDEFSWRRPRFRDRSRMTPIPISGPESIAFFGDRRRAAGIRAMRRSPAPSDGPRTDDTGGCGCSGQPVEINEAGASEALVRQLTAMHRAADELLTLEEKPVDGGERKAALERARHDVERVVGGAVVEWGEFPECACVGDNGSWFCSGVLVAPRVVLTAAHCAPDIDRVYLGGRSLTLAGNQGETIAVEQVVVHPEYRRGQVPAHDIAVLVLARDSATKPALVASSAQVSAGDNVMLVGFGHEHPTLNIGFGTKRKAEVMLTTVEGIPPGPLAEIEERHGFDADWEFFAGRKHLGIDTCSGDSGGPAYLPTLDGFLLAGLTSRAAFSSQIRCGDGGIYTRVAPYLHWISTVTNGLVAAPDGEPVVVAGGNPAGCLYISACLPNPAGGDAGKEWVELTNGAATVASLTGWAVADRQGGRHHLAGELPPGGTRRVHLPAGSPVKLGNKGDDVVLLRGDERAHRVTFGRAAEAHVFRFEPPAPDNNSPDDPTENPVTDDPIHPTGTTPTCADCANNLPDADPC